MTFKTDLVDPSAVELTRIRGTVRFVAAHAVAGCTIDVVKHEWTFFFDVAGTAGGFAVMRTGQTRLTRTAVGIVTGRTRHSALAQGVGVGFRELDPLIGVAGQAELVLLVTEDGYILCVFFVTLVAVHAVNRVLGMNVAAKFGLMGRVVTAQADLVGTCTHWR